MIAYSRCGKNSCWRKTNLGQTAGGAKRNVGQTAVGSKEVWAKLRVAQKKSEPNSWWRKKKSPAEIY